MGSIELNPVMLRQQIQEIEAEITKLERIKNETLSSIQMSLDSAWKGSGADAFRKKTRILYQKLDSEISALKRISKELTRSLKRFEEAERIGKAMFGGSGR